MFSALDKTRVPTGFLWDTAVNLVEREDFNGSALTDSNYVSISTLCDIINSINSASVWADTVCVQGALRRITSNSTHSDPVAGFFFKSYDYIVSNALADNLICYSNDVVSDSYVNGVWQNPYAEDALFAIAVSDEESVALNAAFTILNIDSLSTQTFQSIRFDPGDGGGYRSVQLGGTVTANYPRNDYYEAKMEVVVGGHTYQSHGRVYAHSESIHPHYIGGHHSVPSSVPTDTMHINAFYSGERYEAIVTYKEPLRFDYPIIVSEGFDPWKLYGAEQGFTDYSGIVTSNYGNNADAYLFFDNFDVFYIDWEDCGADIRANAEVLKEVIRWVNDNKTSCNKNIVLGQSMGGLIARYALRDMELNGETHDTKQFISHDVPYLGANVSPGLMFAYRDLMDVCDNLLGEGIPFLSGLTARYQELKRLGSYQSVKQMLLNYVNSSWNYDNSVYNQFHTELDSMGFPEGNPGCPIENVAIVNGGTPGCGYLPWYSTGERLLDMNLTVSSNFLFGLLLSMFYSGDIIRYGWIPGKTTIRYDLEAYPFLSNGALVYRMGITYTKKFLWCISRSYKIKEILHYAPLSSVAYDSVLSSQYYINSAKIESQVDSMITSFLPNLNYSLDITDHLCFIPAASAISSSDYSRNFKTSHPVPLVETPFNSYILSDTSTFHTSFYAGIKDWLEKVDFTNIDGPWLPQNGDIYTIPSIYASSFNWSTSSSSLATIASSGEIQITGHGVVDVIAKSEGTNYVVTKRNRVLAGLPRMVLSSTHSDSLYTVRAECIDDGVEEFLYETGLTDSLSRHWVVTADGTIIYNSTSYCDSLSLIIPGSVKLATVSMTVGYSANNASPVLATIKDKRNYLWNVIQVNILNGMPRYMCSIVGFGLPGNPPVFMLRANPDEPSTNTVPKRIRATAGSVIKRTSRPLLDINGNIQWDLFTDNDIQSYISSVGINNTPGEIVVDVFKSTTESDENLVQTIVIPVLPALY